MSQLSRLRVWSSVAVTLSVSLALAGCTSSSPHAAASSPAVSPSASGSAAPSASAPATSSAPAGLVSSAAPSVPVSSAPVSSPAAASSPVVAGPPATPRLTAIALQRADLPAGWVGTPPDPNPAQAAEDAALATCVGGKDTFPDETGESDSDDYSLDNASISSSAASFQSPADLTSDIANLKSSKIDTCYKQLAVSELGALPAGATLDNAEIDVTPGTGGGPSNVVATATGRIEVTVSGQLVAFYLNIAFITGPSIEAEVDFFNIGTPVPTALRASLIAKVAARAGAAAKA